MSTNFNLAVDRHERVLSLDDETGSLFDVAVTYQQGNEESLDCVQIVLARVKNRSLEVGVAMLAAVALGSCTDSQFSFHSHRRRALWQRLRPTHSLVLSNYPEHICTPSTKSRTRRR